MNEIDIIGVYVRINMYFEGELKTYMLENVPGFKKAIGILNKPYYIYLVFSGCYCNFQEYSQELIQKFVD